MAHYVLVVDVLQSQHAKYVAKFVGDITSSLEYSNCDFHLSVTFHCLLSNYFTKQSPFQPIWKDISALHVTGRFETNYSTNSRRPLRVRWIWLCSSNLQNCFSTKNGMEVVCVGLKLANLSSRTLFIRQKWSFNRETLILYLKMMQILGSWPKIYATTIHLFL